MISSFFNKTRPVNYLTTALLFVFLTVVNVVVHFAVLHEPLTWWVLASVLLQFLTIIIAGFTATINKFSDTNTYIIFLLVLFFASFPATLFHTKLLTANILVLLGIRRFLGLKTNNRIKAKIFDTFLFLTLAIFLFKWAALYLVIAYIAILLFQAQDLRNWIIPFVAMALIYVFYIIYQFYIAVACINLPIPKFSFIPKYEEFFNPAFVVPLAYMALIGFWSVLKSLVSYSSKPIHQLKPDWLIILCLLAAVVIIIFTGNANGAEVVFAFFPLAVLIAAVVEKIQIKWLKETVLWLFPAMYLLMLLLVL